MDNFSPQADNWRLIYLFWAAAFCPPLNNYLIIIGGVGNSRRQNLVVQQKYQYDDKQQMSERAMFPFRSSK